MKFLKATLVAAFSQSEKAINSRMVMDFSQQRREMVKDQSGRAACATTRF